MIFPLEKFGRWARRRFSRSEWAIKRLRLSTSEATREDPGLLIIQIDGFSRTQMERAVKSGRMPFLRYLMQQQHYDLRSFYSGIPSSTPAVQGELFYGVCCAVPAFTFFNRKEKKLVHMMEADSAKAIEAGLREKGGPPLLEGGASWSNIYLGGADLKESHFCAASLGWGDMLKSSSLFGFLSIVILQLGAVIRLTLLLFLEVFIAIWDMFHGVFKGERFLPELKFVVNRVFVSIGLREAITIGAKIDLARGLPIIHVNFLGYDEQAHRRGPGSGFAHWSLGGIDNAVAKLYAAAHRSDRRDYQVWIFSDHGQEKVTPYSTLVEGGIEQTIAEAMKILYADRTFRQRARETRSSSDAWDWKRPRQERMEATSTEDKQEELFSVTAFGPVGHVYFRDPLTDAQKEQFIEWVVRETPVPGALLKYSTGDVVWFRREGRLKLPEEGKTALPHPETERAVVMGDLIKLCEHDCSGDVVLLGWNFGGTHVSFAHERGAHAGPGLDETRGFSLLPAKTRLPDAHASVIRASDLRAAALHFLGRKRLTGSHRSAVHEREQRLRIMTYNVHSCLGMDGRLSPSRIARVIERYEADLVGLQELDLGRARSRGHDQASMIAEELGFYSCFGPTVIHGENDKYGDAILSRHPFRVRKAAILDGGLLAAGRELRGAIWIEVQLGGRTLHFVNTHFGLKPFERVAQAQDLMSDKWLGSVSLDEPIILCGDFNMFPDSQPYRVITARLKDVQRHLKNHKPHKTFAAIYPTFRIDHIFVSPHLEVERVQVPRNHLTRVASDHLPLVTDLYFREGPAPARAHEVQNKPRSVSETERGVSVAR